MELIRSTDYFAAIPNAPGVGLLEPNQQPGIELLLKPARLMAQELISAQALRQHAVAEFSIVALMITTAIVVATVVLNWSR